MVALLVLILLVAGGVVYKRWLGALSFPFAWAALIGVAIAATRALACPGCGQRLGSLTQTACAHCGALLTDKILILPNQQGPIDSGAAAYMARSRQLLQQWGRVRRVLGWVLYAAGPVAAIAFTFVALSRESSTGEAVGLGLLIGVIVAAAAWLVLVHIVDNAVGIAFMALRGRCPLCRAWFTPPSSFGPGSIVTDYSLPQFCSSCGAKLA